MFSLRETTKSVRFKFMGTLGLTLLIFILGYFIFLVLLKKKNKLTQTIQQHEILVSVNSILQTKNDSYAKLVFDYSVFSWMINFINHPSKSEGELTISHPQNLGIDVIQIYNLSNDLVYNDLSGSIKGPITLPTNVFDTLLKAKKVNFFAITKYGLVQFSGSTVHPSGDVELNGIPHGFVLFGKLWDTDYIGTLQKITNSNISLYLDNKETPNKSDEISEIFLKDNVGQKVAHINIVKANPFLVNLKVINRYFDIFFISFCLTLLLIIFYTYKLLVLAPLKNIISALNTEHTTQIERLVNNNDEFGEIAKLVISFFQQRTELKNKIGELHLTQDSMKKLNIALSSQKTEIEEQNARLQFMNKEVQFQNEEIMASSEGLQLANKEITDSINYASLIQKAVLAPSNDFFHIFKEHFVIYRPKNIVSGDFYWVKEMKNGDCILAVADCTGHGLSGSLLSMLGISFLNQIVTQLDGKDYSAALILDILKSYFIQTLNQEGEVDYVQDGMHIALCIFDKSCHKMQYATAFHTICLVRKNAETGKPELTEYKGNRIPVGTYITDEKFTDYTIDLQKDDAIYMFSDGITDQFGGPNNKKFMPVKMRNLLTEVSQDTFDKQKLKILTEHDLWKGPLEQTDDVILVVIKVP